MPLFDEESNKLIKTYMEEYGHHNDRFVKISEKIKKYTTKQISSQWRNYLDPRLCHDPLEDDEKQFIIEQVQKYRTIIHWKRILRDLEDKFGKFRSVNKVKNFWYSNKDHFNENLCHDPLGDDEKNFIIELAQKYRTQMGMINWKNISRDLKASFGKRHSENKIKKFWYAKQKSHSRKATIEKKQKQEGTGVEEQRTKKAGQEQEINNFVLHLPSSNGSSLLQNKRNDSHTRIAVSSLLNDCELVPRVGSVLVPVLVKPVH